MSISVKEIRIRELNPDMIPPITHRYKDSEYNGGCKIVVVGKPGCFAPGTLVLMHDGQLKKVDNVQIGDQIMGDDSTPRTVLDLCCGQEIMYKISPFKGDNYVVNENHILSLKCTGYNSHPKGEIVDITVKDFLKKSKTFRKRFKWYRASPVKFCVKELKMDPYMLGYWLGDGTAEIIECFNKALEPLGLFLQKNKAPYHHFLNCLRYYDLLNNKHIPLLYKTGSTQQRLELLAGLIDSDGSYDHRGHGYDFIQKSEKLLDDVVYLVRSLGLAAYKKPCIKKCTNSPGHSGTYFRCFIFGNISIIPCRIARKKATLRNRQKDVTVTGFELTKLDYGQYYGFELDGNHRFLGHDFTVLHNTGKSSLIKALLYAKKHIFPVGVAMSGSEDTNHAYEKIMPSTFIFNAYDEEKIKDIIKRQKIACAHLSNPWAVLILDDCTDDPKIFNKPLQQAIFKKGRHWRLLYILSLQYAMDVKPVIRTNVDGIFILREPLLKNRESLYKNYASIIPDFSLFCDLMDQLTSNFTALYIHGATQTNKWQDCVFYWKAPLVPDDWKFGCKDYWEFHKARFNPEHINTTAEF